MKTKNFNSVVCCIIGEIWLKILKSWISVSFVNLAEKLPSDDDDDSDKEVDDEDDDSDNDEDDDSNGSQDLTEQLSELAVEEQELEELENPDDQELDKIKIHEWVLQTERILMSQRSIDQKILFWSKLKKTCLQEITVVVFIILNWISRRENWPFFCSRLFHSYLQVDCFENRA